MSALRQWFSVTPGSVVPSVGTKGLGSRLETGSDF